MRRWFAQVCLLAAMLSPAPFAAAALDEAGESAAFLLDEALTPRRDGRHMTLLTALRHLKDPTLKPLFDGLTAAPQASLRLQGILGQAELSSPAQVRIETIGELEDARLQAELIAQAIDGDLLTSADAKQMLKWPGLAMPVKLVIATRQVEQGVFDQPDLLVEAMNGTNLGRKGLAAVLLTQLQDARGKEGLRQLDISTARNRDAIRRELLSGTVLRHKMHLLGPWAYAISTESDVDTNLQMLAMSIAMRFGSAPATQQWQQLYESHGGNVARQRRLGLVAMGVAAWANPAMFEPMIASDDAMLKALGKAGQSIANDSPDLLDRVAALLELHHPIVNNWALSYASNDARPDQAQFILLGLIVAYEQNTGNEQAIALLDDAAQATTKLMEIDAQTAGKLLRPIVAAKTTDKLLKQAVLLGLVRTQLPNVSDVIDGLTFEESDAASLALVMRARDGKPLTDSELTELRLIVRGGSKLQDSLRIQAAWAYLKHTKQTDAALDRVLHLKD